MNSFKAQTLAEALALALVDLSDNGEIVETPDWQRPGSNEKRYRKELSVTYTAAAPYPVTEISYAFTDTPEALNRYIAELAFGSNDHLVAEGKRPYEYHERIAEQLTWVADELTRNPLSTRAVAVVRRPDDLKMSEPPCLTSLTFQIRSGKLKMFADFRSNDAFNAAAENDVALVTLQADMAKKLGVTVGSFTKIAKSFHAYDRDVGRLTEFAARYKQSCRAGIDVEDFFDGTGAALTGIE
ncbi:MAG: thymidylate synthase [Oscillospiraceae bacterium]|jgi:hypothetical protein|nr:thymidylate synthase [Oscillospiraceae bacterium]